MEVSNEESLPPHQNIGSAAVITNRKPIHNNFKQELKANIPYIRNKIYFHEITNAIGCSIIFENNYTTDMASGYVWISKEDVRRDLV